MRLVELNPYLKFSRWQLLESDMYLFNSTHGVAFSIYLQNIKIFSSWKNIDVSNKELPIDF